MSRYGKRLCSWLFAFLLVGGFTVFGDEFDNLRQVPAKDVVASASSGANGVAYILVRQDSQALNDLYRLNEDDGDIASKAILMHRFGRGFIGLGADAKNQIFTLLGNPAIATGPFQPLFEGMLDLWVGLYTQAENTLIGKVTQLLLRKAIIRPALGTEVLPTFRGTVYVFNPGGKFAGPFPNPEKAALNAFRPKVTDPEAVLTNGTTFQQIPLEILDRSGRVNRNVIANADYLNSLIAGSGSISIRSLGAVSRFDTQFMDYDKLPSDSSLPNLQASEASNLANLYASKADKCAVLDSWWGIGGILFEYWKTTGELVKLDFVNYPNPTPVPLGIAKGVVDDIAVDGDDYLYVLWSEVKPSDAAMKTLWFNPERPEGYEDFLGTSTYIPTASGDRALLNDRGTQTAIEWVRIKQVVRKVLKRHTVIASGSLGPEEDRGMVDTGYNVWQRKRIKNAGGRWAWEEKPWELLAGGRHDSDFPAELAVVNVPRRPEIYNLQPPQPSVCRLDRKPPSAMVEEDTDLTFKIEGFQPFITDSTGTTERRGLKFVGSFGPFKNVRINWLPTPTNEYNYDEDNDGYKSGFPSSLFETSSWKTDIKYFVDWIEGTDLDDPEGLLGAIAVASAPTDPEWKDFTVKFPHPGNYAVYADITYRYFDYNQLDVGSRPADLKESPARQVRTRKTLVQVKSQGSLKVPSSFISNIRLLPTPGKVPDAFQKVQPLANAGFDLPEDESPASLAFTFDAQFIHDAHRTGSINETLTNYAGIGVWDYDQFIDLYEKNGIGINLAKTGRHVYNYLDGAVDATKFNPGWNKPQAETLADNGSRIDIAPDVPPSKDLHFIRWNLCFYPTCSQSAVSLPKRGIEVASGSCIGAVCVPIGDSTNRKYRITVNIPPETIATISTPIDPEQYRLRLEIVYPRATWAESGAPDKIGVQYRSIVPDESPIHAVSTVPFSGSDVVSSDQGSDGQSYFAEGVDSWMIRARDSTLPTIAQEVQGFTQSTGDPVSEARIIYKISDNNPVAKVADFHVEYQMADRNWPRQTTDFLATYVANPLSQPTPQGIPSDPSFYQNDSYQITYPYESTLDEFGPNGPFAPTGELCNWVGTLQAWVKGNVADGFGSDSRNLVHQFGYPLPKDGVETPLVTMNRIDNDPPTLRVEIVAQSDNRRWVVQAIEAVEDPVALADSPKGLATCTFQLKCFRLDDGSQVGATQTSELPPTSNSPTIIGEEHSLVDLDKLRVDPTVLPRVRRASRIMVNVDILDNADYLDLGTATIEIYETRKDGTEHSLLPFPIPRIPLEKAFLPSNLPNPKVSSPRARYSVDTPMVVIPNTNQVKILLKASDSAGNNRSLLIPIQIIDSTFDARILESKENRK